MDTRCNHEFEYDPGNYVPVYGWEQYPGMFCVHCGTEQKADEYEPGEPDVDLDRKYRLEEYL